MPTPRSFQLLRREWTEGVKSYSVRGKKLLVVLALLAVFSPVLRAQTLISLGDFGSGFSEATGINDSGQVVGDSTSGGNTNAFLYSGGTLINLGTLGGVTSIATGINASGQIVGYSQDSGRNTHAFLYSDGTMTSLTGSYSQAFGINDSGQVAGFTQTSSGTLNAFLYSSGTMTTLSALGSGSSQANGINASGQIVGYAGTVVSSIYAFLYSDGTVTTIASGGVPIPTGINTSGQVVGYSSTGGGTSAFLYSAGTMTDLGNLGGGSRGFSISNGINDSGQIVGYSNITDGSGHAFLYTTGTGIEDLNTLYASLLVSGTGDQEGFTLLTNATGINSSGEIVGDGTYWNGTTSQNEAFLLNPEGLLSSPSVPEPSTWALMLGGLGGLAVWTRFRCKKVAVRI